MRLSRADCLERLGGARSATLAVNDQAGPPLAVPITFALLPGGTVLAFAVDHKPKSAARLRRLRLIEQDAAVSVLADHYTDDWSRLWWVRADGRATISAAPDDPRRAGALDALAARYPQYREHRPDREVVLVEITRLTGWSGADPGPGLTGE